MREGAPRTGRVQGQAQEVGQESLFPEQEVPRNRRPRRAQDDGNIPRTQRTQGPGSLKNDVEARLATLKAAAATYREKMNSSTVDWGPHDTDEHYESAARGLHAIEDDIFRLDGIRDRIEKKGTMSEAGEEQERQAAGVDGMLNRKIPGYDRVMELHDKAEENLAEIRRRRAAYLRDRPAIPVHARIAIVVDDGIATGATMLAALRAVRRQAPRRLVLAVPVATPDSLRRMDKVADETVCLETPREFYAVGQFYRSFPQLTDQEVTDLLDRAAAFGAGAQSARAP